MRDKNSQNFWEKKLALKLSLRAIKNSGADPGLVKGGSNGQLLKLLGF